MNDQNPHLFIATDAWGATSLWFGSKDDPRPELVQFACTRDAEKAIWEIVSRDLPDYTPEDPA